MNIDLVIKWLMSPFSVSQTFPYGIYPKVNVIARLEFELDYYDSVVQRFNYNTTGTSPKYTVILLEIFMHWELNDTHSIL